MGDLRSKLRAKISRRHSGIASPLPSGRNGTTTANSNSSAEPDFAATATAKATPASHASSHTGQATTASAAQLKGKPRQDVKQLPDGDADGGVAAHVSDASGGKNSGRGGTAGPESAASDPSRINSAKIPTNSPDGNDRHGPGLPPATSDGAASNRNSKTPADTTDHYQQPPSPLPLPTPLPTQAAPAPAAGPTPRVSTDAVRRVRLSDPPVSSDPSSPLNPPSRPSPATQSDSSADPAANTPLRPSSSVSRPPAPPRRQSLLPNRQTTLIRTLLSAGEPNDLDRSAAEHFLPISADMATRKLWVRRPGGSATIVTINEEDLVDDVRELILRKYSNSLGRQFDAPDVTLRIVPREGQRQERVLGPEEPMARTIDAYFPGGQTVDEALLIDVPHRRTPRVSPRNGPPHAQHLTSVSYEDIRPLEAGTDYFGPGAFAHMPVTIAGGANGATHSISVLNTGQVPQIPSPGGRRQYRDRPERPRLGRQHTSSPTILNVVGAGGHTATIAVATNHGMPPGFSKSRPRTHSSASAEQSHGHSGLAGQPLATPPAPDSMIVPVQRTATPPPRTASPRPLPIPRPKKKRTADTPVLPAGMMLNSGVPPISVLIVEDNIINLRLLEAFVKRLKVRWQTAMNGREAVNKWRTGGFHLVLMDIQLPVMSGLEATREIRRLERANGIGVFQTAAALPKPEETNGELTEEDRLQARDQFKSPVIIVALTASSLQSDRHEALAAGCNDFLTKVCRVLFSA